MDHNKTVAEKPTSDTQNAKELAKTDSDDMELVPKKKKKKHKDTADPPPDTSDIGPGDIVVVNGDTGVEDIGDDEVPKRKKKKRKSEPTVNETNTVSIANAAEMETDDSPAIERVNKKRKQREGDEIGDISGIVAAMNGEEIQGGGDPLVTKKIKRKKKPEGEEGTVGVPPTAVDFEGEEGGEETRVTKKAKKKKCKHKKSDFADGSGSVSKKKRKHEAELDNGGDSVGVEGGVVPAKKHKRVGGLENSGDSGLELLSDGASQTVVKKHKKKHKHQSLS